MQTARSMSVSYTHLVTGIYVGYDQLQSLGRLEQGGRTAAPIFRAYRVEVEDRYPADDFVMPEGIVMKDGLAFRSDMPIEGASATAASTEDDSVVDTSQGGEDLMRQMF